MRPMPLNSEPSPTPRRRWWLWMLIAVTVVALGLGMVRALQQRHTKQAALQASIARPATPLQIAASEWMTLTPQRLTLSVPVSGSLSAIDSAIVKSRTAGELRGLAVREGDTVRQGQVLAHVDPTETSARFRQTKLQADAAQAQVTIAQRQYDNNRALVDQGFISSTALATSHANLQAAQANYAAARAAQDAAQKGLDDTVLRSPISGQVAKRMVHNGERMNIDTPVLEIVNLAALEMQAPMPVNDSAQVQIGQQAVLTLEASHAHHTMDLQAEVVRISPNASASNRTVTVYLKLAPEHGFTLRPGMYMQGHIVTGQTQALAVPLDSVRTDQPQPYIQLVQAGAVVAQPVKLGAQSGRDGGMWTAIEGAPAQSLVLLGNVGRLPAGTLVQLQPQPAASADHTPSPSS